MNTGIDPLIEEYIKLSFAMEEYIPGYIDAYFGPEEWRIQAVQEGKLPLNVLKDRIAKLADNISNANMDEQRRDFLSRQITAMQMSQRLLAGERVSLADETEALYDIRPSWVDEAQFIEAQKELDQFLPPGNSLVERMEAWNKSLEISIDKAKELVLHVTKRLREITYQKFDLPKDETFALEWVSDKPWGAYNWYLGGFRSRIDVNVDRPTGINRLPYLIAHEGYPGHHTELSIKEEKLVRQKEYFEHTIVLNNSPSSVISEGIATTSLKINFSDDELEIWYRDEILPMAGISHINPRQLIEIDKSKSKTECAIGNIAFMLFDQQKSEKDAEQYLEKYAVSDEQERKHYVRFVSDPLARSYVFTYDLGRDLLEELFNHGNRSEYFKRLLEEPVTPSQVRQWIKQ